MENCIYNMAVLSCILIFTSVMGAEFFSNEDEITAEDRAIIVKKTAEVLKQYYVYEEIGKQMPVTRKQIT